MVRNSNANARLVRLGPNPAAAPQPEPGWATSAPQPYARVIGVLVAVIERHLGFGGLVGYAGARLDDEGPFHRVIGSFSGRPNIFGDGSRQGEESEHRVRSYQSHCRNLVR
jgi:hypothetical protein